LAQQILDLITRPDSLEHATARLAAWLRPWLETGLHGDERQDRPRSLLP